MRRKPDVVDRLGSLTTLLQEKKCKIVRRKKRAADPLKNVKIWKRSRPTPKTPERFEKQIEYYRQFLKRLFFRKWMRHKVDNTADFIEQVVQERVESMMKENRRPAERKVTRRAQLAALERLMKPRPNRGPPASSSQAETAARRRRLMKRADKEIEIEQKKKAPKKRKKPVAPRDKKIIATVQRLLEPRVTPESPVEWSPKKATKAEIDETISWLLSTQSVDEVSHEDQYRGVRLTREEQNESIERLSGEPLQSPPRKKDKSPIRPVRQEVRRPVRERRSEILKRMRQRLLGPVRGPQAVNLRHNIDSEIRISVGDLGLESAVMESRSPSVMTPRNETKEYEEEEEEEEALEVAKPEVQKQPEDVTESTEATEDDDEDLSSLLSRQVHDAIGDSAEEEDKTEITRVSMDSEDE